MLIKHSQLRVLFHIPKRLGFSRMRIACPFYYYALLKERGHGE